MKWKQAPVSLAVSNHNSPPCASISERETARPMPIPRGLVVKNGSKMRLAVAGSRPGPLSLIVTCAMRASLLVRMAIRIDRVGIPAPRIASTLLRMRLTITFSTCTRFARTGRRSGSRSSSRAKTAESVGLDDRQRIAHGPVQVNVFGCGLTLLQKLQQFARHFSGALGLHHALFDRVGQAGRIGVAAAQHQQGRFGIGR